jgi:hypothetical protein
MILRLMVIMAFTVGTVPSPTLKEILEAVLPAQTCTGRTQIRDFASGRPDHKPLGLINRVGTGPPLIALHQTQVAIGWLGAEAGLKTAQHRKPGQN